MKSTLAALMIMASSLTANAGQISSSSNAETIWVVEASTMIVKGQAAADLYMSMNAPEVRDPMSTRYDEHRTRSNAFATCGVSFYLTGEVGEQDWVMQKNAECQIKAPQGTVINQ